MNIYTAGVGGLVCAVLALAGTVSAQNLEHAARVNGVAITNERLERYAEEYLREQRVNVGALRNPDRYKRLKREALELLINQELLWQAAKKNRVIATEEEIDKYLSAMKAKFPTPGGFQERLRTESYTEKSYREYLRASLSAQKYVGSQLTGKITVSDAEVAAFYKENLDKLRQPEEVQARHILIKLDAKASKEEKAEARKKLEGLLVEVRGGADFAELAKKHSQDSSASTGGDLGFFRHGTMVPPFEQAVFKLKPGETSGVVETPFGLHIIRLEARRGGDVPGEEAMREPLRKMLYQQNAQKAMQGLIETLRKQAKIEILAAL